MDSTVTPAFKAFTEFNAVMSVEYDEVVSTALNKDYWRVMDAFKFYMDDPSDERWVYVPLHYLTDGATVPRFLWGLIPPWGRYGQAAVLHDYLCETLTVIEQGKPVAITRTQADKALKEAMEALDVPRWKRNVMYIGVRIYGTLARIKGPHIDPGKAKYAAQWDAPPVVSSVTVPPPAAV